MAIENFFQIRAEKQSHIVDAAFAVFGRQGYKKASLSDIAKEAGITKGMITYYFGSKKNLYLYLVNVSWTMLTQVGEKKASLADMDFFQKLRIMIDIQISAIREHPAMISFVNSLYVEADPDVADDIAQTCETIERHYNEFLLAEAGASPFKSGVDSRLICKFVNWASGGFMEELFEIKSTDSRIDTMAADFYKCLDLMKQAFYEGDNP